MSTWYADPVAMKLELSIANDAELRAFIQEQVKNAVVAISRGEVRQVVTDTLTQATKEKNIEATITQIVREEVQKLFRWANLNPRELVHQYLAAKLDAALKELIDPNTLAESIAASLSHVKVDISTRRRLGSLS